MAAQRSCAARASSSARSESSNPDALLGWRPIAARTWGNASAEARAARQDAPSIPMARIRLTPAASASATTSASSREQWSRWAWESITRRTSSRLLGEQRLQRLHLRAARSRAELGPVEAGVRPAQDLEDPAGARGQVGVQQHGHDPQALGERAQRHVELARLGLVLG